MKNEKYISIHLKLDKETYEQLERQTIVLNTTKSNLCRYIIRKFLEKADNL